MKSNLKNADAYNSDLESFSSILPSAKQYLYGIHLKRVSNVLLVSDEFKKTLHKFWMRSAFAYFCFECSISIAGDLASHETTINFAQLSTCLATTVACAPTSNCPSLMLHRDVGLQAVFVISTIRGLTIVDWYPNHLGCSQVSIQRAYSDSLLGVSFAIIHKLVPRDVCTFGAQPGVCVWCRLISVCWWSVVQTFLWLVALNARFLMLLSDHTSAQQPIDVRNSIFVSVNELRCCLCAKFRSALD